MMSPTLKRANNRRQPVRTTPPPPIGDGMYHSGTRRPLGPGEIPQAHRVVVDDRVGVGREREGGQLVVARSIDHVSVDHVSVEHVHFAPVADSLMVPVVLQRLSDPRTVTAELDKRGPDRGI